MGGSGRGSVELVFNTQLAVKGISWQRNGPVNICRERTTCTRQDLNPGDLTFTVVVTGAYCCVIKLPQI